MSDPDSPTASPPLARRLFPYALPQSARFFGLGSDGNWLRRWLLTGLFSGKARFGRTQNLRNRKSAWRDACGGQPLPVDAFDARWVTPIPRLSAFGDHPPRAAIWPVRRERRSASHHGW